MTRFVRGLAVGLALLLAIVTASNGRQKDKKDKASKEVLKAREDVLALVKLYEAGKDDKVIEEKLKDIKKNNEELLDLMTVFKIKEKHGLGFGNDPKSGLESRILSLKRGSSPSIPPATLKKEQAELIKLAYVSIAMADVAKHYFPGNNMGKGKKDWDKYCDEQKSAAQDLLKAIKAGDGKAGKTAAKKLDESCAGCHGDFKK